MFHDGSLRVLSIKGLGLAMVFRRFSFHPKLWDLKVDISYLVGGFYGISMLAGGRPAKILTCFYVVTHDVYWFGGGGDGGGGGVC